MQQSLLYKSLLVVALLLASSAARAEYGCQDGFIPVTQGNGQNCVADYNLPYWDNRNSQSDYAAPRHIYADRWGAISIADKVGDSGGFGAASSFPSKRKAEKEALAKCRAGNSEGCAVIMSYYNQCISVAWGDNGYNVARAATAEKSDETSLNECGKTYVNCRIYYSACSLAERTQ